MLDVPKLVFKAKNLIRYCLSIGVKGIALLPSSITGLSLPKGYYVNARHWDQLGVKQKGEGFDAMADEIQMSRSLPRGLPGFLEPYFDNIRCSSSSERFKLVLKQARVLGDAGVIITHDDKIIGDVSIAYSKQPKEHPVFRRISLPDLTHRTGQYGIAYSPSPWNYYHWLYEVVPQLYELKGKLESCQLDGIFVACDRDFQKQWIDFLCIPRNKVQPLTPNLHVRVDTLVIPSVPSRNGEVAPWTFNDFSMMARDVKASPPHRRIYIVRESGRRALKFINYDAAMDLLAQYGFESVKLEDHSVEEQIRIFKEAEVVLAPHGAGLSGICFCSKDAKIIEILAPKFLNVCYWRVAALKGLNYYYLLANGAERMKDIPWPVAGEEAMITDVDKIEKIFKIAGVKYLS